MKSFNSLRDVEERGNRQVRDTKGRPLIASKTRRSCPCATHLSTAPVSTSRAPNRLRAFNDSSKLCYVSFFPPRSRVALFSHWYQYECSKLRSRDMALFSYDIDCGFREAEDKYSHRVSVQVRVMSQSFHEPRIKLS
jgi:hypothetical protein